MGEKKTGNKYALLIGCNYPGTKSELRASYNDIRDFYGVLKEHMGWDFNKGDDITVMEDTNNQLETHPTGKNIKVHLKKLVNKAKDGDVLFVLFCGHGCQIPTDDPDEPDGKDECIVPCDHNIITDDELSEIFAPLGEKDVKLTFVAGCCHSGTMLDHKQAIITGPMGDAKPTPQANARSIDCMHEALGADDENCDIKNRSLPLEELQEILSERMGMRGDPGNVRDQLANIFGEDFGGSTKSRSFSPSITGDVSILVSSCMDRECSTEIFYKPPCKFPAYSLLIRAITTVLKNRKEKEPISNRELVLAVRESISRSGPYSKFRVRQSPCLECDEKWADTPFILRSEGTLESDLLEKAKIKDSQSKPKPPAQSGVALWSACNDGRLDDAVKEIGAGADLNVTNKAGATPLYIASFKGRVDLVRLLLDKGAAVGAAKTSGATPLFIASQEGHLDTVRLLLDRGAAMEKARKGGDTPLFMASQKGHLAVTRLLLDRGADMEKARNDGLTPLMIASQLGNISMVRMLCKHGANVLAATKDGVTALEYARKSRNATYVVPYLEEQEEEARKSAK